jgi:hypothetical protein
VTNKTKKRPSLIDKCCHQFFSFVKFSQNEKSKRGIFFHNIWTFILVWYHFLNLFLQHLDMFQKHVTI